MTHKGTSPIIYYLFVLLEVTYFIYCFSKSDWIPPKVLLDIDSPVWFFSDYWFMVSLSFWISFILCQGFKCGLISPLLSLCKLPQQCCPFPIYGMIRQVTKQGNKTGGMTDKREERGLREVRGELGKGLLCGRGVCVYRMEHVFLLIHSVSFFFFFFSSFNFWIYIVITWLNMRKSLPTCNHTTHASNELARQAFF